VPASGVGVVQGIDAAAAAVTLFYQHSELDDSFTATSGKSSVLAPTQTMDVVVACMIVTF
jgi:hypothetical protein